MIKNDFRYIIKKILIGIGIILGISFIRSCNVYALEDTSNMIQLQKFSTTDFGGRSFNTFYDKSNDRFYLNKTIRGNFYESFYNYNKNFKYYVGGAKISGFFLYDTELYVEYNSNNNSYSFVCKTFPCHRYVINLNTNDNSTVINSSYQTCSQKGYCSAVIYASDGNVPRANFDIYNENGTKKYFNKYFTMGVQIPEIISLNATLNKTDDNMLVSVSFSPEFSFIDTDNYNYYAWFDGEKKFSLTQNNVNFNTQNNTTFFVEVTDKKGNSIDTETYTVSSIGLVYNGNYDIQFITNEYTDSDTSNNSDLLIDSINRIDIDITYIPKWVNYKYQYQFVPQNSSITDNWVLVNDNNDKNNIVYSASSNGTMYARILDKNNKVLKSETFTITRIGELKYYDNNSNKIFSIFNKINNDINFGGPVSNLITIPVNVVETILQAGSNKCTPYYLGSIHGHSLSLTCINPEDYLGSALWSTIDIIVSGCMIYSIFKWLTSLYWNFVILSDTPDIDPSTFGDRRDLK